VEEVIGETPYPLSWLRVTGAPGDADPKLPRLGVVYTHCQAADFRLEVCLERLVKR
jgi:hypothetical protein